MRLPSRCFCLLITITILACTMPALAGDPSEAVLARYPAPSPDGSKVAFSYQGDIWVVPAEGGRALRLTVHQAYDHHPRWSPDGSEIAFSSDRFGNDDVFVIPSAGGAATRLTYYSGDDTVTDWSPCGQFILFESRRDWSAHRNAVIYKVPRAGGTPVKLFAEWANEATMSPDKKWVAYTSGFRGYWWRKNYRGAANSDIWLHNLETGEFERLTDHPGNDAYPMWSGDGSTVYYQSDAGGAPNIWKVDVASGDKTQVTDHSEAARFPAASADGSLVAYELGADIYTLGVESGNARKLEIIAPSDSKFNSVERLTFGRDADEMEPSADNEEIAFVVRGEIFAMKEKGGEAARLTDSPARDRDITWKPDGTAIVFASDRDGDYNLYMVESDDPQEKKLSKALAFKLTRLTEAPGEEISPRFSPDGKKLAYVHDKGDLYVLDWETKADKVILEGWARGVDYSWSPDSRWITYSRPDNEFNDDVWIIPAEGGAPVNISRHPDADSSPCWSPDGRKLAFVSKRIGDNYDIWFVFLRKEDDEKTHEDWEEEEEAKKAGKKEPAKAAAGEEQKGEEKKAEEKKEEPGVEVKIDFDDIHLRLRRVASMAGVEFSPVISPDGQTFAFVSNTSGEADIWTVKWDGTELTQLTKGGASPRGLRWSKDGKKIYFIGSGGAIRSAAVPGGKTDGHAFQARMDIDHPAERSQKFEESWRVLNELFYDPNFHGVDWPAMREKYRPLALAAVETRDFNDVVNLMFGELNASHMGIRGGPSPVDARESTGMLGVRLDESYAGPGLRVSEVLEEGPCDKIASRVLPGQYILEIESTPVSLETNVYELLADTVGRKIVLTVADAPDAAEKKRLIVRPVSTGALSQLLYQQFVDQRREMAHRLGGNRIGYLHIQAMSQPSFELFENELYSEAHGKDAIIIDVRNNGGGSTTDLMLAVLQVKPHAITVPRDGEKGYPISERLPLYAWWKPIVVLCNEYSFSNAEIFPWSIKTLGRGLVIGQQTFGAVISTGGYGLIDGSFVRTPSRGWYVYGSGINMENNGCPPDIVVEVEPGDEAAGLDRQLERAVEELKKQLTEGQ